MASSLHVFLLMFWIHFGYLKCVLHIRLSHSLWLDSPKIFIGEYKLWNSLLRCFIEHIRISCTLGPNAFLITTVTNTSTIHRPPFSIMAHVLNILSSGPTFTLSNRIVGSTFINKVIFINFIKIYYKCYLTLQQGSYIYPKIIFNEISH
jgi:hypothetical protein